MSSKTQKKDAKRKAKKKADKAQALRREAEQRETARAIERYKTSGAKLPSGVPGNPALPHVLDFCQHLSPNATPMYLVPQLEPSDKANECFINVQRRIDRDGGDMVCGYAIWEIPSVLIEGEFHGVWRTKTGEVIDVSPLATQDPHRTFLPAPDLKWEDHQRDNVRKPLVDDPRVRDYIKAHEAHYQMLNRGDRREQFGEVCVDRSEVIPIATRMAKATYDIEKMLGTV